RAPRDGDVRVNRVPYPGALRVHPRGARGDFDELLPVAGGGAGGRGGFFARYPTRSGSPPAPRRHRRQLAVIIDDTRQPDVPVHGAVVGCGNLFATDYGSEYRDVDRKST